MKLINILGNKCKRLSPPYLSLATAISCEYVAPAFLLVDLISYTLVTLNNYSTLGLPHLYKIYDLAEKSRRKELML